MSDIRNKIEEIEKQLQSLNTAYYDLIEEELKENKKIEEAKIITMLSSEEVIKLASIRKNIKELVVSYNEIADSVNLPTNVVLLTKGGHNIYSKNEEGMTDEGEFFVDYDTDLNEYPYSSGWLPSSYNC